jgi:hypothetical protein
LLASAIVEEKPGNNNIVLKTNVAVRAEGAMAYIQSTDVEIGTGVDNANSAKFCQNYCCCFTDKLQQQEVHNDRAHYR